MRLFSIIFVLALLTSVASATENKHASLIEGWMKSTSNYSAKFTQLNSDATTKKGVFTIKNWHKFRFIYNDNSVLSYDGNSLRLLTKNGKVIQKWNMATLPVLAFFDGKHNLQNHPEIEIRDSGRDKDLIWIVIGSKGEDYGEMELVWSIDRQTLTGWIIRDKWNRNIKITLKE